MKFVKEQNEDSFIRNYMNWIGHSEFGLDYKMIHSSNLLYPNENEFNHWLEQWYLTYKTVLELSVAENGEFYLIGYESLCSNPKVWVNVKDLLGINQEIKFLFKESKKVIGGIGIRRVTESSNVADLDYAINLIYQGKGYASEAVRAIFELGFSELNLNPIFATCDIENIDS